jgi:predicted Zn-dependent peptidase
LPTDTNFRLFLFHVRGARHVSLKELVEATQEIFAHLPDTVDDRTILGAIRQEQQSMAYEMEDPEAFASLLGRYELLDGSWQSLFRYQHLLSLMDVEQIRSTLRHQISEPIESITFELPR